MKEEHAVVEDACPDVACIEEGLALRAWARACPLCGTRHRLEEQGGPTQEKRGSQWKQHDQAR